MLAAALQDYRRLVKTEFVQRYLTRPVERRGIHRQLNKGESIFALEHAVFYGNEGRIRLSVDVLLTEQWDTHQLIFSASSTMIPAGPRT